MRDYVQYCPVALASSVIAERWTPLIVRELVLGGRRFNDIDRGLPGISRSLLKQRLDHLERKGVVTRVELTHGRGHEYLLTPAGRDLEAVLMAVGEWAVKWMFSEPEPAQVDPVTLTWWMSRRIVTDAVPEDRTVIEFDYGGVDPTRIWMVLERRETSVCTDPLASTSTSSSPPNPSSSCRCSPESPRTAKPWPRPTSPSQALPG